MTATVARISIAPVKSLGLVHPDGVELGLHGVAGDRRFWLVDGDGRLMNNTQYGPLVRIHTDWDETTRRLALTFPDGEVAEGIVELGHPIAAEMYGEPLPSHTVIGPWQDALARHVGEPLHFLWADEGAADRSGRGGTVSLVSRASLERLGEEAGVEQPVDGRRFRMLFEIDGVAAHEEDEWLGAQVQLGEAVIVLNGDVGRCVTTTHDPDSGVTDLDTLKTLAGYRREGVTEDLPFGVYGAVVTPGRVNVGDIARLL